MISEAISVSTPAMPSEAVRPVIAELLTYGAYRGGYCRNHVFKPQRKVAITIIPCQYPSQKLTLLSHRYSCARAIG